MAKSYVNFNGFKSQDDYQTVFNTLKQVVEEYDCQDRDYFSVHFDKCIECIVGEYRFYIWDDCVEIEILNEKLHLVDSGITAIVKVLYVMLEDGDLCWVFDDEE